MKTADITVDYVQHCGSDLSVVNAARVSFDKESTWRLLEESGRDEHGEFIEFVNYLQPKDEKLISYLAKHKHTSPFNHSFITVRVKAPIFVARQLVKHKFLPWNEVSRRYVDNEPEFFIPEIWRKRSSSVKQGSSDEPFTGYIFHEYGKGTKWDYGVDEGPEVVQRYTADQLDLYNALLAAGICPEQARMVLPLNTMTEWMWSGTLGAFCDMLRLRLDPHAQYESRVVAQKIKAIIEPLFPVSVKALLNE